MASGNIYKYKGSRHFDFHIIDLVVLEFEDSCFSEKALELYFERKGYPAHEPMDEYDDYNTCECGYCSMGRSWGVDRADPLLVAVIRELGKEACKCGSVRIVKVVDGFYEHETLSESPEEVKFSFNLEEELLASGVDLFDEKKVGEKVCDLLAMKKAAEELHEAVNASYYSTRFL